MSINRYPSEKLYINDIEASSRYGYSRQWFQRERWKGTGPAFIKVRGRILYPIKETDDWFASFALQKSISSLSSDKKEFHCTLCQLISLFLPGDKGEIKEKLKGIPGDRDKVEG